MGIHGHPRRLEGRLAAEVGEGVEGQGVEGAAAVVADEPARLGALGDERGELDRAAIVVDRDARLDRESDALASSLLAPLSAGQRERLVEAMSTVERLLTAGLVEVAIEDPRTADAQFCLRSHYAELDERFDTGFDPDLALSTTAPELTEPASLFLIARLRGEPIGCGALKLQGDTPFYIKRMWVAPTARGLGVGRRLLSELEAQAATRGAEVVSLETNATLREATSLYRSSGYVEVEPFNNEPYAHHWFRKRL